MAQKSEFMMSSQNKADIRSWIGLAHVRPRKGNSLLEGAKGAFVPVVAIATGKDEFISIATAHFSLLEFDVVILEDVQLFEERLAISQVDQSIVRLVTGLTVESPIATDTFQAYEDG